MSKGTRHELHLLHEKHDKFLKEILKLDKRSILYLNALNEIKRLYKMYAYMNEKAIWEIVKVRLFYHQAKWNPKATKHLQEYKEYNKQLEEEN